MCRILGTRVYELEKKLKTLEMTGLWNFTGTSYALLSANVADADGDSHLSVVVVVVVC